MTLIVSDCMDALCKLDCNMLVALIMLASLVLGCRQQPGWWLLATTINLVVCLLHEVHTIAKHCSETVLVMAACNDSLSVRFASVICKNKHRCSLQRTCMLCAWACAWRRFYEFDLKLSCWAYETPECICRLNILHWRFQTCILTPTILCTVQFWKLDIGFMRSLNCCQKLRFWR